MKRYRSSASTITSRSSPSRRSSKGTLVPGPPRLQIFRYKSPSEEGVSPATLEIRSPGSTPARSAGPSGTAPETNKRSIASEAYSPSQGLGWPDARPRVTSYLYDQNQVRPDQCLHHLREFLAGRWKGQHPVLWDRQLIQSELLEAMHCGFFGLELENQP